MHLFNHTANCSLDELCGKWTQTFWVMMKNLYSRTEKSSSAESLTQIILQYAFWLFLQINYYLINYIGRGKLGGFVTQ